MILLRGEEGKGNLASAGAFAYFTNKVRQTVGGVVSHGTNKDNEGILYLARATEWKRRGRPAFLKGNRGTKTVQAPKLKER